MDLDKFTTAYPVRDPVLSQMFYEKPASVNKELYKLKELYTQKTGVDTQLRRENGQAVLQPHQVLFSRLFSTHTPYSEVLALQDMGTGKTLEVVSLIYNNMVNGLIKYGRGLILVPNDTIKNKFIMEIAKNVGYGKYMSNVRDPEKRFRQIKTLVSADFEIETHQRFANMVAKSSKSVIVKNYSNRYIVVDEIQNIRNLDETSHQKEKNQKTTYWTYHGFFHSVENCTKIIMSGTPVKDRVDEIADLMNLILPMNMQMPTDADFYKSFYVDGKLQVDTIKPYLEGRFSFLRASYSNIGRRFMGETLVDTETKAPLPFIVSKSVMKGRQLEGYRRVFNVENAGPNEVKGDDDVETKASAVYHSSRVASNFVFPEGKKASDYFKNDEIPHVRKNGPFHTDIFNGAKTMEEKLKALEKYSSKYAADIRLILDKNTKGTVFVYNPIVNKGGGITFAACLSMFGFSALQSTGEDIEKRPRYALIIGKTKAERERQLRLINSDKNVDGEYVKVIIGSKAVSTGIDIFHVSKIIIQTPYWNLADGDQAITRGFRIQSHALLQKKYPDFQEVEIYLRVSVDPDSDLHNSIEYRMYNIAVKKDLQIKELERVIKESAIDCPFNYERNAEQRYFVENSRQCEYRECRYKCLDVLPTRVKTTNNVNYNNLYADRDVDMILDRLREIFKVESNYTLLSLNGLFKDVDDKVLVRKAIVHAITQDITFYNSYGIRCVLRESAGNVFLVENPVASIDEYAGHYNKNILLTQNSPIRLNEILLPEDIKTICSNPATFEQTVHHLPPHVIETFIETAFEKSILDPKYSSETFEIIKDRYFHLVKKVEDGTYIIRYRPENPRCIQFSQDGKSVVKPWSRCPEKMFEKVQQADQSKIDDLEKHTYYGVLESSTGKFKVRALVEGKRNKGKVCVNFLKDDLAKIADYLGLEEPMGSVRIYCQKIQDMMAKKNMILYQ